MGIKMVVYRCPICNAKSSVYKEELVEVQGRYLIIKLLLTCSNEWCEHYKLDQPFTRIITRAVTY